MASATYNSGGGGGGGGGAPVSATYITQTPNATLTAEQALSLLTTGISKHTTGTGVVSTAAAGTDYITPTGTAPVVIDGTGLTTTDMLTVLNGKTASGYVAKVTGAAPTGLVLQDSGGTRRAVFGIAVSANDWITGSAAGDTVILNEATTAAIRARVTGTNSSIVLSCNTSAIVRISDLVGTLVQYGTNSFQALSASWVLTTAANVMTSDAAGLRLSGATTQKIGAFNATPVVQQARGATLTNSVTAGGTDDTIANFTDLTLYANDAATIRNDIYQLARAVRMHDVALRALGFES